MFYGPSLAGLQFLAKEGFALSFVPQAGSGRSFNFQDTLQAFALAQGLPFAEILDAERIASVLRKHGAIARGIYTPALVLWAFLGQVLRDGKEASCQSAVARIVFYLTSLGRAAPTADTGDYCRARAKLPEAALHELSRTVAQEAEAQAPSGWLWKDRHAKLIDGFTFLMPDTPANQQTYPQHVSQLPGVGFPIARGVVILSLATGCALQAVLGPYQGKETGETALLRKLLPTLNLGDLVVADRYYCNYWIIALMIACGVDVCFRNHQLRRSDFRRGKRLGKHDHCITWSRPQRPAWMTPERYATLPLTLELREVRYTRSKPGRKQQPLVIITTLLSATGEQGVSVDELGELYSYRWNAELDLRSLKTFLHLDHVRCKTPAMVHREFWTIFLAYNLIRVTMAASATLHGRLPRNLSFVASCQYVLACWSTLADTVDCHRLCRRRLEHVATCCVGNRGGRLEPRVIKKRNDRYQLMKQPRHVLRRKLKAGDNSFEN